MRHCLLLPALLGFGLWFGSPARATSPTPPPVTILWPRLIPRETATPSSDLASKLQDRLIQIARNALPGRSFDVRPEGERSCPDAGCPGGSVGVLLVRKGNACALVGMVGKPGRGDIRLIAWGGRLVLKKDQVEFRDPPESSVKIEDYGRCDTLLTDMEARTSEVETVIRTVHGTP
jgi:hypothetical protein